MKLFKFYGTSLTILATFMMTMNSASAGGSSYGKGINYADHSHNDKGGYWHTHGGSSGGGSSGGGGYGGGGYGGGGYGGGGYGGGGYGGGGSSSSSGGGYFRETFRFAQPTYTQPTIPGTGYPTLRPINPPNPCLYGGCGRTPINTQPIWPGNGGNWQIPNINQNTNINQNSNNISDSFNTNINNVYKQVEKGLGGGASSGGSALLGLALPLIGVHILSGGLDKRQPIINYYPAHSVTATQNTRPEVKTIVVRQAAPTIIKKIVKAPEPIYRPRYVEPEYQPRRCAPVQEEVCDIKFGSCAKKVRKNSGCNYGDVSYDFDTESQYQEQRYQQPQYRRYQQPQGEVEILGGIENDDTQIIATTRTYEYEGESHKVNY